MGHIRGLAAFCLLSAVAAALPAAEFRQWNGRQPSALELKDLSGRTHTLSDYRGKVLLVNFWATWCEPCRKEMPSIDRLNSKLAHLPFAVLAVNVDEPEARIRKFLSELPLNFPVLLDPGGRLARTWNVRLLPASFLIGPNGRIRYTVIGELDWDAPEVTDRIVGLLPEQRGF